MVSTPTISRQRPGSACEECRRRKVRCDRRRPQCQVCFETGIECKINTTRLPRGPRKGQLRTLRTRIAALERCLADQHPEINHQMASLFNGSLVDMDSEDDPLKDLPGLTDPLTDCLSDDRDIKSPISLDSQPRTSDQLYFDRVHPFAPILQRWRYHVWAKGKKTDAQTCLQYAMWTVAASLSAQFQSFRDSLYQETRQMLDTLDMRTPITSSSSSTTTTTSTTSSLEQAQAWVLVSIYEYMHLSPQQAWMSAGRCCRLVLGMRLYELDDPNNPATMAREQDGLPLSSAFGGGGVDWTGLEEQRRTFWMAYSLDRFISFHNGLPFTLNEGLITTRLPAPEEEFQAGQPVVTRFLAEVMARSCLESAPAGSGGVSSFGECIILATICGRALSHRQKLAVEQINGDVFDGLWTRHQWLHELLSHRIQVLSTSTQVDSMLIFARIVAQTMVLYLHNVLESIVWKTGDHLLGIIEYERLCVLAAHEVVNLVKLQGQLGYFKVHPLTPIPLMMCTEFFTAHGCLDSSFDGMLRELLECLQDLDRVKNPIQSPQLSVS
ncbi:fungal-specific transcription factor domain protein [Aspergillus steynii IBT 23096]|uniref:Fungal-specific transcription factor domain protein n=1 Tax=Aspergillus steynii IBT 23096 TaxID=1392250 RepID=A0A2I2GFH3_9EURO|nr:fungal-specific transcription factor domain protein [Aspergillus steynii IBT 23096]PLB51636.1 fungal-specific transcription factor domain protein [Aspergillus steynii IBT 23096]